MVLAALVTIFIVGFFRISTLANPGTLYVSSYATVVILRAASLAAKFTTPFFEGELLSTKQTEFRIRLVL
jgi:hypothetical protein